MRKCILNKNTNKKIQKFSVRFCAIDSFISPFGNNSLLYPIKLARLPPHSVTVCEFMHEVHILQTPKSNTRCGNEFLINIRKKQIQKFRERFCVNVIFLTSPRSFSTYSYQFLHFGPNFQSMSTP